MSAWLGVLAMRMFGRPRGLLGRWGGRLMARMNARWGARVADLVAIASDDSVLEVGFGAGVTIAALARLAPAGHVVGVDPSPEMVLQARARNAAAIRSRHVELRCSGVEHVPFPDESFDKALAINSMQVWPDAAAGLAEIWRVMKPGGILALGFTSYSGRSKDGLTDLLGAAGFTDTRLVVEQGQGFCALARKPAARGERSERPAA